MNTEPYDYRTAGISGRQEPVDGRNQWTAGTSGRQEPVSSVKYYHYRTGGILHHK